jgi:hypothetical protein
MGTMSKIWADVTGASAYGYGLSADEAKANISAAVSYLLKDATASTHGEIVRDIVALVHAVADEQLLYQPRVAIAPKQSFVSGIPYKAYVIDAFQRDKDNWRATIRRLDGKKVRVAVPPMVRDEFTTSADALTAEKAVEFAQKAIERGEVV